MNRRSRVLIGASILAIGAVTFWLAATQAQPDVRQVGDVVADPQAHGSGRFTLVGVPEAELIPVTTANGMALEQNPQWSNMTRRTVTWFENGETRFSTHTLRVEARGGQLHWSFRNETRRTPAEPIIGTPVEARWTHGDAGQAFPVEAFAQGPGGPTRIWALYGKAPEAPLQPKPSQFKGHLMTSLPDGSPVPEGALVWIVEEYTAGCSSKFLPPEAQQKYNVTE